MKEDLMSQGKHSALAILWATMSALTLERWVMVLSAIFLVLQLAYLARKWWREEVSFRRGRPSE
jgi:hypothetical protein